MGPREGVENLYQESKIDKIRNIIIVTNCQFVYDQLRKKLPEDFSDFYTLNTQLHHHNTGSNKHIVPNVSTTIYESNSITLKAIKQWNKQQKFIKTDIFSSEMTYSEFLISIKTYIENQ